MQRVRENELEVLYTAQSPSDLTPELVSSLFVPGKSLRIEWPRQLIDMTTFSKLSKHYYVQIGMEAPYILFDKQLAGPQAKSFDDETTKRLVGDSYENGYAKIWKDELTDHTIQKFRQTLASLANGRNTRIVEFEGKIAGLVMVDVFETYRGKRENHLGWIWIDASLLKSTRQLVATSLLRVAAEMAPEEILAAVFVRNIKSYSFLRKAGFESICAQLSQL